MQDLLNGPNRNARSDRPKIAEFFGKAEGGIKKSLPPDNFFFSLLCASRSRFDEANRNAKWRSENYSVPPTSCRIRPIGVYLPSLNLSDCVIKRI